MHDFMRSILEDKYGWVCEFHLRQRGCMAYREC